MQLGADVAVAVGHLRQRREDVEMRQRSRRAQQPRRLRAHAAQQRGEQLPLERADPLLGVEDERLRTP